METEEVNNKALVDKMRSFLDLWKKTKDIKHYYEYQKYFQEIKENINVF